MNVLLTWDITKLDMLKGKIYLNSAIINLGLGMWMIEFNLVVQGLTTRVGWGKAGHLEFLFVCQKLRSPL